jgi:hypothetical protein
LDVSATADNAAFTHDETVVASNIDAQTEPAC